METYDVVISGYGPTGLAAASLLSGRGHRVCVIERWPTLYGMPRMATIDGETARIIQAASDIDDALRNSVARPRYVLANGAGEILVDHDWNRDHVSGFPFRISLHQPDIEDAMDARARRHGVDVLQGWEVVGLEQDGNGAVVTVREREGDQTRAIGASWVIGADGARSAIRELLGIECDSWPARNAWLSFDAVRKRELGDLFGLSPDGRVAVIFCAPEGRAHSIIPLGTTHLRINFEADPDIDPRAALDRAAAYRRLEEVYGLTENDVEIYREAFYPFEGKLARTWRVGRAFLAGDAAHVMTPFQGQGGCSALRDAANLSWKLDLVLRGEAPQTLLDTYEAERKPHVRVHIDGSDRLAAMIFTRDPAAAEERDARYLSGQAPAPAPEPTLTAGVLQMRDGSTHTPVGGLAPQGTVRRGGEEGRFDDLFGWGFQLIAWNEDPARRLSPADREWLNRLPTAVAGLASEEGNGLWADVEGRYAAFFSEHGVGAVLIRPDFTVFGAVETMTELPALIADLAALLQAPN
jgi:3-(3-hydroxy-phenyl)propionate hydroxylase